MTLRARVLMCFVWFDEYLVIVCITWFVMCYNVVCLVISTWMSLENILENVLSCTVYKNCKRKQIL